MIHFWVTVLACVVGALIAEMIALVMFSLASRLEDDDEG